MARTILHFPKKISVIESAAVTGELEAKGPLGSYFDLTSPDSKFGMDTWEKAEAEMVRECSEAVLKKSNLKYDDIDFALGGDLTNQCAATTFGLKDKYIPHIGLYGACSTFALSLGMGAISLTAGLGDTALCLSSSHYCSAERQYRFPLEYGCQRTPTAQTTVTGAGGAILKADGKGEVVITEFFPGIVRDQGITDANNMGAAMAPACCDTLLRYFEESGLSPDDFDGIYTGDLGFEGHQLLVELCSNQGLKLGKNATDCGMLIYDAKDQKVSAGGSGCGCSASVFCGYLYRKMKEGLLSNILLIGTGALLNANTVLQKETIPGVAHLIRIQKEKI